ncbi:MAG: thioredoxin family protein [Chloroflexota bacterium]
MNNTGGMEIKILCYRNPVCYSVWRIVQQVINHLAPQFPQVDFKVSMIKDSSQIVKYSHNLVLPSLVINGKIVCSGDIPDQVEVLAWLQEALVEMGFQPAVMRAG